MKKFVIAQIGCGAFAEQHDLPNFSANPRCEVRYCCDVSPARARELAARFHVPHAVNDIAQVLSDPAVDIIKVATSHEAHLPIIEAAAAAGKHILCEKPMALYENEAFQIMSAVRKHHVKLAVDMNRRMSPAMIALRKRFRSHLANPQFNSWRFVETDRALLPEEKYSQFYINIQDESSSYRMIHLDPRTGGGIIMGETVHWLDLACWFFAPQHPVEITAWGSPRLTHGIHLKFESGDSCTINYSSGGSFDYPKESYYATANGIIFRSDFFVENNYYGVPGASRELFALERDPLPETGSAGGLAGYLEKYRAAVTAASGGKAILGAAAVDKGHRAMIDGFLDAIEHDLPSPCDESAGWTAVCLARLAIQSIELGKTLRVGIEKLAPALVF